MGQVSSEDLDTALSLLNVDRDVEDLPSANPDRAVFSNGNSAEARRIPTASASSDVEADDDDIVSDGTALGGGGTAVIGSLKSSAMSSSVKSGGVALPGSELEDQEYESRNVEKFLDSDDEEGQIGTDDGESS